MRSGRKISLVGWSLGGLYARQLAKMMPDRVRSVITLGSPFAGHPKATNAWRVYEMASGRSAEEEDHRFGGALSETPPVPTTAIFSRTDGICAWQGCMEKPSALIGEYRGREQPLRHGPSSRRGLRGGRSSGAAGRQLDAVRPQRLAQHRLSGSEPVSSTGLGSSLRAQRSNPSFQWRRRKMDCFVASLLAMTKETSRSSGPAFS